MSSSNDSFRTVPFNFSFDQDFLTEFDYAHVILGDLLSKPPKINMISLPEDVLENIFTYLPIKDVLLNMNVVCRRFNAIINGATFLKFKKLFYKYRSKIGAKTDDTIVLDDEFLLFTASTRQTCFVDIAQRPEISQFKKSVVLVTKDLHKRIESLSSYKIAKQYIDGTFDEQENEKPSFYNYLGEKI